MNCVPVTCPIIRSHYSYDSVQQLCICVCVVCAYTHIYTDAHFIFPLLSRHNNHNVPANQRPGTSNAIVLKTTHWIFSRHWGPQQCSVLQSQGRQICPGGTRDLGILGPYF